MFDNLFAKCFAFIGIIARGIKGSTRHAHRLRGNANAPAFKVGKGNFIALPFGTQHVFGGHPAFNKSDLAGIRCVLAEFFLGSRHDIAGRIGWHDEGGNTAFSQRRIGHGKHNGDITFTARGDELFGPVNHPMIAIAHGAGCKGAGIGTGLWFGQAEHTNFFAQRHGHQKFLFLGLGAEF